jgi:hypothetical protein
MPGKSTTDRRSRLLGVVFFAIALAGTAFYGWEFGSDSGLVPTILGALAVALVIVTALSRKR